MTEIRNIAIIAHVDHGKTTLVDKMLHACKTFKDHETPGELIMDSNELEKERGITILAKNLSVRYKGAKINIIDTPGHADFGGEVERVLNMADGVLLLVDAFEGPMPQTRFVLQKALEMGLKPIVVINKVDKPNCRPEEVQEEIFDLMISLDADEHQLDFPTIYGSSKEGWMSDDWKKPATDINALMDCIIRSIPPPKILSGTPQLLITSLDYSSYVGRIAIGKLQRGTLQKNTPVALVKKNGSVIRSKIRELMVFEGLEKRKADSIDCGDICAIVGIEQFDIGDTIADSIEPEALDPIAVDEPTISMVFTINNSPFYGQDGKYVTSRHLWERLEKELEKNLALRVGKSAETDVFTVYGRGVLHLSILIETMRREGYELQVGQPRVIIKMLGGEKCEPMEFLTIDLPEEYSGKAIEQVTKRRGEMVNMERKGERIHLDFHIPSRGIIGLRNILLTATAGEAVISHLFKAFEPLKGEIENRQNGSLIAMETGTAYAYSIDKLQDRGTFFIHPGTEVYAGQVIGENTRMGDLVLNITKPKKLTNFRVSGSEEKVKIPPPLIFTLEEALEYIQEDEYVEVTPNAIRLRKIWLDEHERKRRSRIS